MMKLRKGS